ncbi:ornithine decarboxylase-like, partial [Myripristis murdjan]|uniref:ornithine decarboxylase-like n=1 Tax=Myripristis murdjan TaxID=586833 RepID=UPI001175D3C4
YARTHGVQMMTFDNQEELSKIARCHASAKLVLRIAVDDSKSLLRHNSKFEASLDSAGRLLQRAGELGLDVVGTEENVPERVMVYYINDGVYGSLSFLINAPGTGCVLPYLQRRVDSSEQRYRSVIWGPTCNSLDKLTDSCLLPELQVGAWLLIDNTGAYTVCLSTTLNGFGKPPIYSVVTPETWQTLNPSHT